LHTVFLCLKHGAVDQQYNFSVSPMKHITNQSVLMDLMHVAGKDAADQWLTSNPKGTEAELIAWLVEHKPKHLREDLAREKADHIAWRFIGLKELHRHARASFPTPIEGDAWMDAPNKIFNGQKPGTFAGMRRSGAMVREVIDAMKLQR
jgi:hypothetical protein